MSANNKEGQDKHKKVQTSKREQTLAPNAAKKKKDEENSKDAAIIISNQPVKYVWTQTNKTVTIDLQVDGIANQLDDLDVEFTDIDVNVVLPDERRWSCTFYDLTEGGESRVEVRATCISLRVTKTSPQHWPTLQASPDKVCTDEDMSTQEMTTQELTTQEMTTQELTTQEMTTQELTIDLPDEELQSPEEKQEELIFLDHIKNDWMEKSEGQSFQLHIYVKNTYKDTVDVLFKPQLISIKFQTDDAKFLSLHPGTNDGTTFCWKILIRHEIVPASCKYRVLPNLIEVTLGKKEKIKWGALERPHTKDASPSTSDLWQPVCKVSTKSATAGSSETCQSNVVFDEFSSVKAATKVVPPLQSNKENVSQKPTCKVSPMNKIVQQLDMVVNPGTTGLDNLGNTCFMNSILQALANTREFRDYFLDASFQREINVDNPLGMGGKLAVSFAILLKVLWSGKHYSYAPSKLRNLVAMKASRFTGFAQHDAQEFMAFLLDGLHEDLNRVKAKPYSPTVDSNGRPNEIVANEAWARHRQRDDSFVVDLFHGQYKSKLVCPDCGKVSITFDPFLYLPLPLPKKQRVIRIIFLWKDPYKKPVRFVIRLSLESSFEKLKDAIYYKTEVNARDIRVFQAYKGKIYKLYSRGSDISAVQSTDIIIACEVLSKEVAGENVYEVTVIQRTLMPTQFPHLCSACKKKCPEGAKLKRCTQCYKVGYCDQTCQKVHWLQHKPHCRQMPEPVGCPFIISLPESRATFSRLCQLMEAYARYSVDVFQPPVKDSSPTRFVNQTSNSNLSSSSQSSGSLNSLDSQSSCSSSCTITAEPEQQDIADIDDDLPEGVNSNSSLTAQAGSYTSLASESASCEDQLLSDYNKSDSSTPTHLSRSRSNDTFSQNEEPSNERCTRWTNASGGPPTNMVLGIQNKETERSSPLFYLKPIGNDGQALKGPDGSRLEDQGDVPLDLSSKKYMSMDWKNKEKLSPYVLLQTKELDFDEEDNNAQNMNRDDSNVTTLEQCLNLFTEPEVLSQDEAWYCPVCKEHQEATKELSIWRLPHTLIVQLKRFSFRNFIWRDKIDKMVDFPTRGLDLTRYHSGIRSANEPPPIYDLYAVVNHYGGMLGGHYTSFVRCADPGDWKKNELGWRLCDDSHITSTAENNIVTRGAYILFYRHRNMIVSLPPAVSSTNYDDETEDDDITDRETKVLAHASKVDKLPELEITHENVSLDNDDEGSVSLLGNQSIADDYTDMDSVD